MAQKIIEESDLNILKAKYFNIYLKLDVATMVDGNLITCASVVGEMKNGGSCNIDSKSDIRRTFDADFYLLEDYYNIGKDSRFWLDKYIIASVGVSNCFTDGIKYFSLGVYVVNNNSYSYSSDDNSVSVSLVDLVSLLNGERNGIMTGMLNTTIEAPPDSLYNAIIVDSSQNTFTLKVCVNDSNYTVRDTSPYYWNNINFRFKITIDTIIDYAIAHLIDINDIVNYKVKICIEENNSTSYSKPAYYLNKQNDDSTWSPIIVKDLLKFTKIDYICYYNEANNIFCFLGNPNTISGAMKSIMKQYTPFSYLIDDIGANSTSISEYNYPSYIPYKLEFSTGTSKWDIITKLRDLYPGWETFFDEHGVFNCREIPNHVNDPILISSTTLSPLVISEKSTYDFNSVKNITEIWGKCQTTDRYDDNASISIDSQNHKVIIDVKYAGYACDSMGNHNDPYVPTTNELLGFTMPQISDSVRETIADYDVYIRINYDSSLNENLPELLLMDDKHTEVKTIINKLQNNIGYCFRPSDYIGDYWYSIFYGEFQTHAVCILTDKSPDEERINADRIKYNCNQVSYIYNNGIVPNKDNTSYEYVEENCPYTVEKIGEIPQVLSGNEFDDIYTTDLARQRAEYECWKAARLTDSLTVDTILIPFLDVQMKIEYQSLITGEINTYIIDKVSHSFDSFTTSIEMHRFYPTYPFIVTT